MNYRVTIEGPAEHLERPIEEVLTPGACIRVETKSGPLWLVGTSEDLHTAPWADGRSWERSIPLACIQGAVGFGAPLRQVLAGLYYDRSWRCPRVGVVTT
jgi:hypothetical protein